MNSLNIEIEDHINEHGKDKKIAPYVFTLVIAVLSASVRVHNKPSASSINTTQGAKTRACAIPQPNTTQSQPRNNATSQRQHTTENSASTIFSDSPSHLTASMRRGHG
jgi:hypothetical protein